MWQILIIKISYLCRVARLFYVQTVTLFAIQRISLIYILALKRGINKTWIGLDQINLCNLLNHSRLGDKVTGVELIWSNPGFAALHKTATLHLGMWKTGKCQHLYTCIFLPFPFIAFGPLFPFTGLSLCLTADYNKFSWKCWWMLDNWFFKRSTSW